MIMFVLKKNTTLTYISANKTLNRSLNYRYRLSNKLRFKVLFAEMYVNVVFVIRCLYNAVG